MGGLSLPSEMALQLLALLCWCCVGALSALSQPPVTRRQVVVGTASVLGAEATWRQAVVAAFAADDTALLPPGTIEQIEAGRVVVLKNWLPPEEVLLYCRPITCSIAHAPSQCLPCILPYFIAVQSCAPLPMHHLHAVRSRSPAWAQVAALRNDALFSFSAGHFKADALASYGQKTKAGSNAGFDPANDRMVMPSF